MQKRVFFPLLHFFSASAKFREKSQLISKLKGIVYFEIKFWHVLAYLKGIQDVGVFVSTVVSILIFLGQTVLVYQSYMGSTSKSMHREVQIKHDSMT